MAIDFSDLLTRSQRLSRPANQDLPQLQRNLSQITSLSRTLAPKGPPLPDARAIHLLSAKGVDAQKITQNLDNLDLGCGFAPLSSSAAIDTDIDTFLQTQYETLISSTIEDHRLSFLTLFEKDFEASLAKEWEETKKKVFDQIATHQYLDVSMDLAPSAGGLVTAPLDSPSDTKIKAYANVIRTINDSRLAKRNIPVIHELISAAQQLKTSENLENGMSDVWALLSFVLDEKKASPKPPLSYSKAYREFDYDPSKKMPSETVEFNTMVVNGAKRYLEKHFYKYVEDIVRQHHAAIGGIPTVSKIVAEFINIRWKRFNEWSLPALSTPNNKPIFAQVYYLLRSGYPDEAEQYITAHPNEFAHFDPSFITYFRMWRSGKVEKRIQENLLMYWNQHIRPLNVHDQKGNWAGGDPFRVALYKLFGCIEIHKKKVGVVNPAIEDYLWYLLNLVRETSTDEIDRFNLKDMATSLLKFGQDYYNAGKTPVMYLKVLLICGEFEKAAHYLSTIGYNTEAVHMTIACMYYGALRIRKSGFEAISEKQFSTVSKSFSVAYLDAVRLLAPFINIGMEYLYALGVYPDCQDAATSILCECLLKGDVKNLIGYVHDGIPGTVQKYMELIGLDNTKFKKLLEQTANKARDIGLWEKSVMLYDACGKWDTVLDVLEVYLSESFTEFYSNAVIKTKEERKVPANTAESILHLYMQTNIAPAISALKQHTLGFLISVHKYMDEFVAGRDNVALEILDSLDVFPLSPENSVVRTKCSDFETLSNHIKQCFGIIVMSYGTILKRLHEKSAPVRERVKALVLFLANVRFKLQSDAYMMVNKLDVQVN